MARSGAHAPPAAASDYWEAQGLVDDNLPAGWRRHARDAHLALLDRWVGSLAGERWLKTDLQEEGAPVRSLLPHMSGHWVGVDVAASVVRAASATAPIGAVADVRHLPFGQETFDGVLSTSTLDHFDEVEQIEVALRELLRVLRPGGRLVLTLDNIDNPLIRLRNALPERRWAATGLVPFHVGPTLSVREGTAMLSRVGFQVQATAHLLHAPHIVGTRAARFAWFERRALPWFDRLATTRLGRFSGHYGAFLARRP